MNAGKTIKKIRLKKKLTKYRLAKIADVSESLISRVESGERMMNLNTAFKIAKALNVSLDEILEYTPD